MITRQIVERFGTQFVCPMRYGPVHPTSFFNTHSISRNLPDSDSANRPTRSSHLSSFLRRLRNQLIRAIVLIHRINRRIRKLPGGKLIREQDVELVVRAVPSLRNCKWCGLLQTRAS
jgi:hypothetical protein